MLGVSMLRPLSDSVRLSTPTSSSLVLFGKRPLCPSENVMSDLLLASENKET